MAMQLVEFCTDEAAVEEADEVPEYVFGAPSMQLHVCHPIALLDILFSA